MAEVTPETTDDELKKILDGIDLTDQEASRAVMKNATPRQVFMVAMPYGMSKQPDIKEKLAGIEASVLWVIEGDGGGSFGMTFSGGELTMEEGDKPDATATVTLSVDTWKEMANGDTNPQAAFMSGKMQVAGDMSILMQLQGIMPSM